VIGDVLQAKLHTVQYHADHSSTLAREIADEIKHRMKEEDWPRYKYVVQVVIGEQRGEGVKMGCRNFWDSGTDSHAQEVFANESLFCVAAVFGLYYY
jgi:tctex1 domain-containing protein 2